MSKAPARRSILCPRCDTPSEVSGLAKSINCPGCHRNIRTEDETVTDYQARVEYYNEGRVEVAKKGIIIAEVRVRDLVVKGEVRGPVRARGAVSIAKTGRVFGDIVCAAFSMEDGAQLVGRVEFGPRRPAPERPAPPAPVERAAAIG